MKYPVFFILTALLLSSCAIPEDVIRIDSTENNVDWLMGKQVVTKSNDSVTIALKYEQNRGKYLIFDTEILNNSNNKLTVSPTDYIITGTSDTSTQNTTLVAMDPEIMLLEKDIEISRNMAAQKNAATTSLIVNTAMLATNVAMTTSNRDTPEKAMARAAATDVANITTAATYHSNVAQEHINLRERSFWAMDALRKTTLYPGESIRGNVLFPKNLMIQYFNVEINLSGIVFIFHFKQTRIPATNTY